MLPIDVSSNASYGDAALTLAMLIDTSTEQLDNVFKASASMVPSGTAGLEDLALDLELRNKEGGLPMSMVVNTSYGDGNLKVYASLDSRSEVFYASLGLRPTSISWFGEDLILDLHASENASFGALAAYGSDSLYVALSQSASKHYSLEVKLVSLDNQINATFVSNSDFPLSITGQITHKDSQLDMSASFDAANDGIDASMALTPTNIDWFGQVITGTFIATSNPFGTMTLHVYEGGHMRIDVEGSFSDDAGACFARTAMERCSVDVQGLFEVRSLWFDEVKPMGVNFTYWDKVGLEQVWWNYMWTEETGVITANVDYCRVHYGTMRAEMDLLLDEFVDGRATQVELHAAIRDDDTVFTLTGTGDVHDSPYRVSVGVTPINIDWLKPMSTDVIVTLVGDNWPLGVDVTTTLDDASLKSVGSLDASSSPIQASLSLRPTNIDGFESDIDSDVTIHYSDNDGAIQAMVGGLVTCAVFDVIAMDGWMDTMYAEGKEAPEMLSTCASGMAFADHIIGSAVYEDEHYEYDVSTTVLVSVSGVAHESRMSSSMSRRARAATRAGAPAPAL